MPKVLNDWLPTIFLLLLLTVLISAVRVYVGGPDRLEVVWKDGLSFDDTVVNVVDYAGLPRSELAKKPKLLAQMEDMGLLDPDNQTRRRVKKKSSRADNSTQSAKDENKSEAGDNKNESSPANNDTHKEL